MESFQSVMNSKHTDGGSDVQLVAWGVLGVDGFGFGFV